MDIASCTYIPNSCRFRGIGIRIEDNLLITADGTKILNDDCPKETDEIEKIVAS